MTEKEFVTLEDGLDYIVLDIINDYAYLVLESDPKAFCIRKIKKMDDLEEYFVGLDNDKEFDKALLLFTDKHKELI